MLKVMIITASLAVSTAALAAPARLTDVQFMQLARCRALVASSQLGGGDVAAFDAAFKAQRGSRDNFIYERADQLADDAARDARRAGPDKRNHLIAERDGVCQALIGGTMASGGAGGNPHGLN